MPAEPAARRRRITPCLSRNQLVLSRKSNRVRQFALLTWPAGGDKSLPRVPGYGQRPLDPYGITNTRNRPLAPPLRHLPVRSAASAAGQCTYIPSRRLGLPGLVPEMSSFAVNISQVTCRPSHLQSWFPKISPSFVYHPCPVNPCLFPA